MLKINNIMFVSKLLVFKNALNTTANITRKLSPNKAFAPTSFEYPLKKSNMSLDPLGIKVNNIKNKKSKNI